VTKRWVFWLTLGVLFLVFLYLIRGILLPFVVGMFAAYFLDPVADRLEKRGFSRNLATLLITGGLLLTLIVLCIVVPPILFDQLSGLLTALPEYIATFKSYYNRQVSQLLGVLPPAEVANIKQAAAETAGGIFTFISSFITGIFHSGFMIVNVIALILITPVVTFYLLRDWDNMVARFDALLPRQHAAVIRQQLTIIDQTLAGFLRGQFNVCLLLAAYYAIGLSLAGLKFGLIVGVVTGFLVIVPYIGAISGFILGMGIAFYQFDNYADIMVVLAVFGIGQALETYFLTPRLIGEKVGLHPVWIIFGMLTGGALFGFVGVLLAVPATAVIGVLIRFATERYLQSDYYSGKGR